MKKNVSADQVALGLTVFSTIGASITLVVYPILIQIADNFTVGMILIFLFSLTVRFSMVLFYDSLKIDWLLIESIKAKTKHQETSLTKKIERIRKLGYFILFIVLIFVDPFLTVIYFRPGCYEYNGFKRTKIIFLISNFLCIYVAGSIINLIIEFSKRLTF